MVWLCLLIALPTTTPMAKQINSFIENTSRVAWIIERNYLTSLRQSVSRTHEAVVIVALVTPIPASQRSLDKLAGSSTKPGPDAPCTRIKKISNLYYQKENKKQLASFLFGKQEFENGDLLSFLRLSAHRRTQPRSQDRWRCRRCSWNSQRCCRGLVRRANRCGTRRYRWANWNHPGRSGWGDSGWPGWWHRRQSGRSSNG